MGPVNSEKLGETCMDGGTCHHKESCTERCFRRQFCSPLTLAVDAGLTMEQWHYPPDPKQLVLVDDFRGDNASLVSNIKALLEMDAEGTLVPHGVGGHARGLLAAAALRLQVEPPPVTDTQVEAATMALVGFGTDPAPGTDWFACRSWRINKVRALMRKALEVAVRTK